MTNTRAPYHYVTEELLDSRASSYGGINVDYVLGNTQFDHSLSGNYYDMHPGWPPVESLLFNALLAYVSPYEYHAAAQASSSNPLISGRYELFSPSGDTCHL